MRYFVYARKSQEDDGRQVQSIGDQLKIAGELAAAAGVEIAAVFQEAKSAKRPGRPIFNEMIARIEDGEADGIIAWHPDRLSRNAVDAGVIIDLLDRGKIADLKFQTYKFENTPEGKWMLNIVLGQSKYQVDKLSTDVKRGIRSKLEKGHYPQVAPPGYRNNLVEHTIEADPERFEMIQRAMKLVLTGAYSGPQALDILNNQWGFRTIRRAKSGGKPLARSTFHRMLTGVFYTGLMEHKGQLFPGKHPAMLTQEEFDSIQRVLGRRNVLQQKREFDFTGLIRCGSCGCLITAETKRKHYKGTNRTVKYTYYHCTNAKGGCSKRSVTHTYIETQIQQLLSRVTLHPGAVRWCLDPAQRWHEQEAGFSHETMESLQQALAGAQRKKTNLIQTQLEDPGTFTASEFKEAKDHLQGEINRLHIEIRKAEEKLEEVRRTIENVFDFAVNAAYNFEHGGAKLRKEIVARLGVKYSLTLGNLEIEPHPLLVPILTLEPHERGFHNKKDGSEEAVRLTWLAMRDQVRTRLGEHEGGFPAMTWKWPIGQNLQSSSHTCSVKPYRPWGSSIIAGVEYHSIHGAS